jgi:hypothetical protein
MLNAAGAEEMMLNQWMPVLVALHVAFVSAEKPYDGSCANHGHVDIIDQRMLAKPMVEDKEGDNGCRVGLCTGMLGEWLLWCVDSVLLAFHHRDSTWKLSTAGCRSTRSFSWDKGQTTNASNNGKIIVTN